MTDLGKDAAADHRAADLEKMAAEVEASPDYRVLRRLTAVRVGQDVRPGEKMFRGAYLDVEATGLDLDRDEVIEIGVLPFMFTSDGKVGFVDKPFHSYREPGIPITEEITRLTGITPGMVGGKQVPMRELEMLLSTTDLVLAHHAAYDRPMVERLTKAFEKIAWGCSMSQVPWADAGISGRRLEYVLAGLGMFYEAHNAAADCMAGLYGLTADVGGKTALAHVLAATRGASRHVWAIDAPFHAKDDLKKRGYFWNGGEDGRPKAWHREIPDADAEAEQAWLERAVYKRMLTPARFDRVTAFERFTKRG